MSLCRTKRPRLRFLGRTTKVLHAVDKVRILLQGTKRQMRRRHRLAAADHVIEVSFSKMSISHAAACRIASRCASFERRKVALSSVNARL